MADANDWGSRARPLPDLPEQMAAAVRSLTVTGPLPAHDEIANCSSSAPVRRLGGGPSNAVAGPFITRPLVVHKGFEPPSFVPTLIHGCIAISASGDSPEVVASAGVSRGGRRQAPRASPAGPAGRHGRRGQEAPTVFLPR